MINVLSQVHIVSSTDAGYVSPVEILPMPKAGPRKQAKGGRQRVKTRIVADTPEKAKLLQLHLARLTKKQTRRKKPKCSVQAKSESVKVQESSESSSCDDSSSSSTTDSERMFDQFM